MGPVTSVTCPWPCATGEPRPQRTREGWYQVIEAVEGGPVCSLHRYMLHWLGGAPGVQGTDYSSGYHKSHLLNNYSYWGPDGVLAPERRAT